MIVMMYNAKTFGQRVLLARRDLNWEQDRLAQETTVSRSRISEIERGKASNVGIEAVFSLAQALGVTVPYLLGLSDDPLGEGAEKVLKEQSGEYVVFDVDEEADRRTLRQLVDDFLALSPSHRRMAQSYLHMMREIEEEEHERAGKPPKIVGGVAE